MRAKRRINAGFFGHHAAFITAWSEVVRMPRSLMAGLATALASGLLHCRSCRRRGPDGCPSGVAAGYPFVFGFTVYESFESEQVAQTGIVPMPGSGETGSAAIALWQSVMTTASGRSLFAIRGVPVGACKAIA